MSESESYRDRYLEAFSRVLSRQREMLADRPRSKTPVPGALDNRQVAAMVGKYFGADLARGDTSRLETFAAQNVGPAADARREAERLVRVWARRGQ